ncbi:hypothetical protein [Hymenobacter terrenus]|nr:hypothetical protein [Hymenobacter terrenus]
MRRFVTGLNGPNRLLLIIAALLLLFVVQKQVRLRLVPWSFLPNPVSHFL